MFDRLFKRRRFKIVTTLLVTTLVCSLLMLPITVLAQEPPQDNGDIEGEYLEGEPTESDSTGLDTIMAVGEDILDVGAHSHCYSYSGHARGYYFTAPIDFTITALRVPTNCSSDVQSITVLKINSPLPNYPSTTNGFTILGLWQGIAGSGWIECNIPVAEGQLIGIIGARGTSTMYNSYPSTYTYSTTLGGYPVTLRRLATNNNITPLTLRTFTQRRLVITVVSR